MGTPSIPEHRPCADHGASCGNGILLRSTLAPQKTGTKKPPQKKRQPNYLTAAREKDGGLAAAGYNCRRY
jgi:hypothetical protein